MTQSKANNTITITNIDSTDLTCTIDTGSEYTFNVEGNGWGQEIEYPNFNDVISSLIDPSRVETMCDHYPGLRKAWNNFYSIYKMVDQDYKGNYEYDDEVPL
jgi:hypothetical protein